MLVFAIEGSTIWKLPTLYESSHSRFGLDAYELHELADVIAVWYWFAFHWHD